MIKIRIWHIIVFVLMLVAFAIASVPAAFVGQLSDGAMTFQRARGTIWNATFEGVQLGAYQVDTLAWKISPLDLVQGKIVVPMRLTGDIEGEATLLANNAGDRRIIAPRLRVTGLPLDGLVLAGETQIQDLDIFFDAGICSRAQGQITSDVLVRSSQALRIEGPPLAGQASCDGEDAVINLAGQNPSADQVSAVFRLRGDGAGQWRLALRSDSTEVQAALSVGGFQRDAATGELVRSEELRWLPF